MTSPETAVLRQRLVRMIADRTGVPPDAKAVAAAARRTQDELVSVFAPLISAAGVEALAARAFDLTQREYPAAERRGHSAATDDSFGLVSLWLERQAPSAVTDAAAAMFATFAELLTALIGEPLTMRYLQKAWPDAFSDGVTKGKKA